MDYETLVKIGIRDMYERKFCNMRKLHISVLLNRMIVKNPNFIRKLYFEIMDTDMEKVTSAEHRIGLMSLVKIMETKYNIKVYGHQEIWRGLCLDVNDIRYNLTYVLAENFIKFEPYLPLLQEMIDKGILKPMDEMGCDENDN